MLFGFDVDAALAEMNALSRLAERGLDGRHGLRPVDAQFIEQDGGFVWTADLPGVSREDLKVTVENGVLTVEARRAETSVDGRTARHRERRGFDVRRSVELPESVDTDGIAATIEHGVLTLKLPQKPETRPRTIAIKAS